MDWADISIFLFAWTNLAIALAAMLIDRFLGYPDLLYRLIRHPVVWIGALIKLADFGFNRDTMPATGRGFTGLLALCLVVALVLTISLPVTIWLRLTSWGWIGEAILAASLISQRSLLRHVRDVAAGLSKSLETGRDAIRHIVGRDPTTLDESGVARGAIESLAENASDGVIAPLFWLLIAGLPGILIYKAVNTADSMIGYRNEKYLHFGAAAARFDDLVNIPASRLSGIALIVSRAVTSPKSAITAWRTMCRDAPKHVSPNAGWPEAAIAGALDIRLGGPRKYGGKELDLPWLGDGRADLNISDIDCALALMGRMFTFVTVILIAVRVAVYLIN